MKSAWGQGYATEAALHTVRYGLLELRLEMITAMALVDNIASWLALEKIGIQFLKNDVVQTHQAKIYTQSLFEGSTRFVKQT